jgi:hypothetical protein
MVPSKTHSFLHFAVKVQVLAERGKAFLHLRLLRPPGGTLEASPRAFTQAQDVPQMIPRAFPVASRWVPCACHQVPRCGQMPREASPGSHDASKFPPYLRCATDALT